MTERRISSPTSTGGAGTFFEQHVAAYWLAQLLVRGIPPILINTAVAEVHFQTEHLGWHTDDFLIVCGHHGVGDRRISGQVKRSFTVSAANDECRKAIQDFWKDFSSAGPFDPANDRQVLVTLRGTNTLLKDFAGLLDCARVARDEAEFIHRLETPGLISKKAVHYCGELSKIITDLEGGVIEANDIWPFLRLLHVLPLDLHSSTRQTEAHLKNLLAHTVTDGDPGDVANATWSDLLELASSAMSEASSFNLADLPEELRQRHGSIGANEQRILQALKDHTLPVLRSIRSTIGGYSLCRAGLVQQVLEELETSQIVLVSGPAGIGKSVIAKDAVSLLDQDHFVFGFRAEEFAQAHIDSTLHVGQTPTSATTLAAILATQGRKVVLIESVERLLEKATRDAFSDLMALAAEDRSMGIILTCREYSVEQVRASFLRPAGVKHSTVGVPRLSDAELAEVEGSHPSLENPLKNPALRDILRNPYFLDKALEITWSADRPVPESEREFRALFWRQIVRADHDSTSGTARKREEVFQKIALHRARALSAHVMSNDLDPDVVAALLHDSLIVSSDKNPSLVAVAHDVLEDWAILQWLEEQYLTNIDSFESLSDAIGTHPAIRRSYRKWVAELIETDPDAADSLFGSAITETEIGAQFRDDTLVSLLWAPLAPEFLLRHETQLLANDKFIFKRVIHLLRVACVTTPAWLTGAAGHGSIFYVPEGPAWATVLRLVYQNIDSFAPQDCLLLIGLIEDAVQKISWWEPKLDGQEFVAGIGYWLLKDLEDYHSNEPRKRVLKVIAKVPAADSVRFESVLRSVKKEERRRDRNSDDLREILLSGLEGMPAARDLPDLLVSIATEDLLISDDDLRNGHLRHGSLDVGKHFGIKEKHTFFPASAHRGPWFHLLVYHPRKALAFMVNIFNYSADWYVQRRQTNSLEPALEIELTFSDGTTQVQWGNQRLWNLYRGTSVGPDALQCLLMALEKWLFEYADKYPSKLDAILVDILRRSKTAALSSVVASVGIAHPHNSGEALLVLLSVRDYISFDRVRVTHESQASTISGLFPQIRAENKLYEKERKAADQLPHRNQDLEAAILNLQLGPLAPRVQSLLDQHLAALPPKSEQQESDLVWRLAIHRMDFRQYSISDTSDSPANPEADEGEGKKNQILLEPQAPDPELQAMVDESTANYEASSIRTSVLMWGIRVFNGEAGNLAASLWREQLTQAQKIEPEIEAPMGGHFGPGVVAAVCVRDHWDEMSVEEQAWCVQIVCYEVLRHSDQWSSIERVQQFPLAADRSCARVVPVLLNRSLTESQTRQVREALAAAITHPIKEVRWHVTWGIDEDFWATDPIVAMHCVNAIATEATLIDQAWEVEEALPSGERRQIDHVSSSAAIDVRERFWQKGSIADDASTTADISKWFAAKASARILAILGRVPNNPTALAAYEHASRTLVDWWDAGNDRRGGFDRDFYAETALSERLQHFVMQTTPESALEILRPIVGAINDHPREIYSFVQGLTAIEDSQPNTDQYWYLWGLFADSIRRANWVTHLGNEHPIGDEMLAAIFLTSFWKDNIRHWKSLEGHDHNVHALFEKLPPCAIVLDDYSRFLYHIGERSLPEAFVRITASLKQGRVQQMFTRSNTAFLLEVLLQRHVYGRPLELKRDPAIRQAVLCLLDILVENGSAAAFRMRDDFVTPPA